MRKALAAIALAIVLSGTSVLAQQATSHPAATPANLPEMPADLRVQPVTLDETRSCQLVETKGDPGSLCAPPSLKLTLKVSGPLAERVHRYGKIEIAEALDDRGASLKAGKTDALAELQRTELNSIATSDRQDLKNGFLLDVRLSCPTRSAARIARLYGWFTLVHGGRPVSVIVSQARVLAGQQVDNNALKEAGVILRIVRPEGPLSAEPDLVAYTLAGNLDSLLGVEMVNAAGMSIPSNSGQSESAGGQRVYHIQPAGAANGDVGLKLNLVSAATVTRVPIAVTDLALP